MTREIGDREGVVRAGVNKIGRKCTAGRVQPAVSQFGLKNAGGAGADEDADALGAIFVGGSGDRFGKPVLPQAEQGQPVVAAIESGQRRGKLHPINAWDFSGKRRQVHRVEGARQQAATLLAQRRQGRLQAEAEAAGRGVMGEPERRQKEPI